MTFNVRSYLESKGLQLKDAGGDNVHTLCPIHGEQPGKRGRFYINVGDGEGSGLWMCHRCDARGNIHTLRQFYGDPPLDQAEDDEPNVRVVFNAACDFYRSHLGEAQLDYLRMNRGLSDDAIQRFRIGFAPKSERALWEYLSKEKNFDTDDIFATGLCKLDKRTGEVRDFLRHAITIPYLINGNCFQIRGKAVSGQYLTPPGQDARLFNAECAWKAEEVIICEGEFDAMCLADRGFAAVGLPGSTSFQERWADYLKDTKVIYTAFDPDDAGTKGFARLGKVVEDPARLRPLDLSPFVDESEHDKPGDCDVTWLCTTAGWDRDDWLELIAETYRANSILVTPRMAFEEFESVQGVDGMKFGIEFLDHAIKPGLLDGQIMVPLAKAEPLDNEIPTPDGIRRMGDLAPGDFVFGSDGKPTQVLGVFPQGEQECFEITFGDKSKVAVTGDHLFAVEYRYGKRREWKREVMSVRGLIAKGLHKGKEYRFQIPMMENPAEFSGTPLPIGPYTLGVLLGDGSLGGGYGEVTNPDPVVRARVESEHRTTNRKVPPGACPRFGVPGLGSAIRSLGIDVKSAEKFIPEIYKTATPADRLALLQGLMDCDGLAARVNPNAVGFCSTSRELRDDVAELVASLGGTASPSELDRSAEGKPTEYILSIMMPEGVSANHSVRKQVGQKVGRYRRVPRRPITSIEAVAPQECQCIAVAAPDSLYVTSRAFLVTHNTNAGKTMLMLNILHRASMVETQRDFKFLYLSLEQTRGDWFDRARRIHAFYDPSVPLDPIDALHESTIDYWTPRLRIIDKNRVTPEELTVALGEYIDQLDAKPDCVIIDYLGYWAAGFKGKDRYERVSEAIMKLKGMAKDHRIRVITPHQVSRGAEFGSEFSIDQARDSGAIEETADFALSLWSGDEGRGAELEDRTGDRFLKIGKSRHGGKGMNIEFTFGYLSLVMVPKTDQVHAAMARAEAVWGARGRVTWEDAIRAHRTSVPPKGFERYNNTMGGNP